MIETLYTEIPLGRLRLRVEFEFEAGDVVSLLAIDVVGRKTIHDWERHDSMIRNMLRPIGNRLSRENRENLLEHRRWLNSL